MRRVGPAVVVLGLAGVAFAVDSDLKKQVKDPDSFKRSDAARALAKDGSADAAKLLVELVKDKNPYVRDHTVEASRKLRDDAANPSFIETLHGVGYRFIGSE